MSADRNGMPNGTTRLAVRLHRRVCLVITEDVVLAEELLARKKLAQDVAGRLSDRALLVRPGRVESVVEELRRMGHTPRVVAADPFLNFGFFNFGFRISDFGFRIERQNSRRDPCESRAGL